MEIVIKYAPWGMAYIMMIVGFSLSLTEFNQIFQKPKSFFIGAISQTFLVPIVGIVIAYFAPISPVYKAGVILTTCVPSAVMSNFVTKMLSGNIALSVALTSVTSLISFITIPFILSLSLEFFLESEKYLKNVNFIDISLKIFFIATVPVFVGIFLRSFFYDKIMKFINFFNKSAFFVFLAIILSAVYSDSEKLLIGYKEIGFVVAILFFAIYFLSLFWLSFFSISNEDQIGIISENTIQNNALAIVVGSVFFSDISGILLVSAVYAVFQYKVIILYKLYLMRFNKL